MPLLEISLPKSPWRHSQKFSELHSALEHGYLPSAFRELSEEDRVEIISHDTAVALMRQVEERENEKEMERQRKELRLNG